MQERKIMTGIILLIYLAIVSAVDIYKREIPLKSSMVCLLLIILMSLSIDKTKITTILLGLLIGLLLLALSMITKGSIGFGDGIMFLVVGSALGFAGTLTVLAGSLILASVTAVILMVFCHVGKKYRIPFAPFVCFTYGGMILFG